MMGDASGRALGQEGLEIRIRIEDWGLEIGDYRLEIGDCRLEIGDREFGEKRTGGETPRSMCDASV